MLKRFQSPRQLFILLMAVVVIVGVRPSDTLGAFTASLQYSTNTAGYAAAKATVTLVPAPTPGTSTSQTPTTTPPSVSGDGTCASSISASVRDQGIFAYEFGGDHSGDLVKDRSANQFDAVNRLERARSIYASPCAAENLAALSFVADKAMVYTMQPTIFNGGSFAVETWFRTDHGAGTLVGMYPESQPTEARLLPSFKLDVVPKTGGLVFSTLADTPGAIEFDSVSTNRSVRDGKWHHVVAIRDELTNELQIYLDGQLEASAPATHEMVDQLGYFRFGCDNIPDWPELGSQSQCYGGDMAWGAAYRRALTPTEISEHVEAAH
ncbi:LamG domain-containing protein [Corynebacterium epidermidicanis]|uniref:LamG domain-containing protein n=1 Tax=Corynebacterium epidermidicanis TaxID=1050174 RepID=UPI000A9940B0|nr:LamG domain-containing protein [Corynebacterium epidermidicanis]